MGVKKRRGMLFLLIPHVKALGLPDLSREAVGQPTCDYIAKTAPRRRDEQAVDFQYNQPWALPLHRLQISRESVLSFHMRRQRLENAFFVCYHCLPRGGRVPKVSGLSCPALGIRKDSHIFAYFQNKSCRKVCGGAGGFAVPPMLTISDGQGWQCLSGPTITLHSIMGL